MKNQLKELLEICNSLAKSDGPTQTGVPGLRIHKYSKPEGIHNIFKPCFCMILQGDKEIVVGDVKLEYHPGEYILTSAQLALTAQVKTTLDNKPYIGIALEIDPMMVIDVLKDLPGIRSKKVPQNTFYVDKVDDRIVGVMKRLLTCTKSPVEIKALSPLLVREIIFYLVTAEHGSILCQFGMAKGRAKNINRAIDQIVRNYAEKMDVNSLADQAGMSPSSFHKYFKNITAFSPLQFQKSIRLMEARRRILAEISDIGSAAFEVGYVSLSQFSREYSRFFGVSPREDVNSHRHNLENTTVCHKSF